MASLARMLRETLPAIEVDGTRLTYREEGPPEGEPVVLLHGYSGNHRTWRHQLQTLAERHRVLALDWLGWGDSERPLDLDYGYEAEVTRLGRVLDALGIERTSLCGHDYGGFLALGLCVRSPQRVARLALLNSRAHRSFRALWYAGFGSLDLLGRTPGLRALAAHLPHAALHRSSLAAEVRRGVLDEALVESYVGWMATDSDAGRWLMRFFGGYSVRARPELAAGLPLIRCPVQVIWGGRDPYLSRRIATELCSAIPDARLTMLEDAGHFVVEERPAEVTQALAALLAR